MSPYYWSLVAGKTPTYESVAAWLTENVKDNNFQNMLVCLKAEIPQLKQIATGSTLQDRVVGSVTSCSKQVLYCQ